MSKLSTLLAVGLAAVLCSIATVADASPTPMQQEIEAIISAHGGQQTSWNTITWDDGAVTLEIRDGIAPTADSCAAGSYCAFQSANYIGNKLTFSACPATFTDFSALGGSIGSMSNKRTTGTVRAFAGAATKATLAPGRGAPILGGITKITCG